ncbi:MAG: hypothetical protein II992_00085 [Lachnospiraceae bacterium]|nr:hypothetical protein [Lachnospiraceae bacterium]
MDKQIERLETVRKQLEEWIDEYKIITDAFVRYPEQYLVDQWHGDVYDKTTEQIWDELQGRAWDIVRELENKLEAVKNKIGEL